MKNLLFIVVALLLHDVHQEGCQEWAHLPLSGEIIQGQGNRESEAEGD